MEHDWALYRLLVEDRPAITVVALGYYAIAPVSDAADLVWLRVPLLVTRVDGLPSEDELPVLLEIEESVMRVCEEESSYFVGRCSSAGTMDFFIYCGNRYAVESALSEALATYSSYSPEVDGRSEPSWASYLDFLYPSPRELQSINNYRLMDRLTEQGDQPEIVREVCHWISFDDSEKLGHYRGDVEALGYTVRDDIKQPGDADTSLGLVLAKEQAVDEGSVTESTLELFDLAETHGAEYRGWESPVMKSP